MSDAPGPTTTTIVKHFEPYLSTSLSALQMVCARRLADGEKAADVRKAYGVPPTTWKKWLVNPKFIAAVESRIVRADEITLQGLAEGELKGMATLVSALEAEKPVKHKDGKIRMHPDWDARVRAAISLLDRRGERGKPVERRVQGNVDMTSDSVRNELVGALADPTVQKFLRDNPETAARLRNELLPPARQEPPPCVAPSPPPLDSSVPVPSSPAATLPTIHPPSIASGSEPSSNAAGTAATLIGSSSTSSPPPTPATDSTASATPSANPSGSTPTSD